MNPLKDSLTAPYKLMSPAETKKPVELYSAEYFVYCGIGGILSCGITHTLVTPLDVVKCNVQANPDHFKNTFQGFKYMYTGKAKPLGYGPGITGLFKGWGPTCWGYSVQGLCKFGFYEIFKYQFAKPFSAENAHKYRDLIYMTASASAEFIADICYCPFEAVKVRVQTSPKFATGLMDGLPKIVQQEGFANLYAALGPLWARQIPYTVVKFMAFERIAEFLYDLYPKPKAEMNKAEQMTIVFSAGYLAGILCGVISHPADTLVSKINKLKMEGSFGEKVKVIYKGTPTSPGIGFMGLWKGLAPRVVMIGTLTGLQWFIYGAFKVAVGLPAPGGAQPAQKN